MIDPGDDGFTPSYCPVCGADMEWVDCWYGCDEGYFHDCGEDCCCCLEPEPNQPCPECHGVGRHLECSALPHTDEQLREHDAKHAGG